MNLTSPLTRHAAALLVAFLVALCVPTTAHAETLDARAAKAAVGQAKDELTRTRDAAAAAKAARGRAHDRHVAAVRARNTAAGHVNDTRDRLTAATAHVRRAQDRLETARARLERAQRAADPARRAARQADETLAAAKATAARAEHALFTAEAANSRAAGDVVRAQAAHSTARNTAVRAWNAWQDTKRDLYAARDRDASAKVIRARTADVRDAEAAYRSAKDRQRTAAGHLDDTQAAADRARAAYLEARTAEQAAAAAVASPKKSAAAAGDELAPLVRAIQAAQDDLDAAVAAHAKAQSARVEAQTASSDAARAFAAADAAMKTAATSADGAEDFYLAAAATHADAARDYNAASKKLAEVTDKPAPTPVPEPRPEPTTQPVPTPAVPAPSAAPADDFEVAVPDVAGDVATGEKPRAAATSADGAAHAPVAGTGLSWMWVGAAMAVALVVVVARGQLAGRARVSSDYLHVDEASFPDTTWTPPVVPSTPADPFWSEPAGAPVVTEPTSVTVVVVDDYQRVLLVHDGVAWGALTAPIGPGINPVEAAVGVVRDVTGWPMPAAADLDAEIAGTWGSATVVTLRLPGSGPDVPGASWATPDQVRSSCGDAGWTVHLPL